MGERVESSSERSTGMLDQDLVIHHTQDLRVDYRLLVIVLEQPDRHSLIILRSRCRYNHLNHQQHVLGHKGTSVTYPENGT